jgi:hypothetical protein
MYSAFADSEFLGGEPYGSLAFEYIFTEFKSSFFNDSFQKNLSLISNIRIYERREDNSTKEKKLQFSHSRKKAM